MRHLISNLNSLLLHMHFYETYIYFFKNLGSSILGSFSNSLIKSESEFTLSCKIENEKIKTAHEYTLLSLASYSTINHLTNEISLPFK